MSNIFTPMRTETRLDYFGVPYTVSILGREKLDYKQLWDKFIESQQAAEKWAEDHKIYSAGHHESVGTKMPEYFESQNLKT